MFRFQTGHPAGSRTDGQTDSLRYLNVVEDGSGNVCVKVNQSFLLQELRQRAGDNRTMEQYINGKNDIEFLTKDIFLKTLCIRKTKTLC